MFRAQLLALNLHKVMLNAANIYLFGFILTKCKYIYAGLLDNYLERPTERQTDIAVYSYTSKNGLPR